MLAAAYKDIYKQLRINGQLPDLTVGYEIDQQTGGYYSDFYSKQRVLGNPSSDLKPYIEPEAVNFAVNFFTEDFRTLADRNSSFGEKLEAGFFIIFRPAKAAKKVAKASDEVSDARKSVSRSTGSSFGKNTVGAAEQYIPKNIKMVNDRYLKKKGIDAHALKQDFVGRKNISHYDIYVDKDTGMLWIYRKGGKGEPLPTYEYIK